MMMFTIAHTNLPGRKLETKYSRLDLFSVHELAAITAWRQCRTVYFSSRASMEDWGWFSAKSFMEDLLTMICKDARICMRE